MKCVEPRANYIEQLESAARAVTIHSSVSFSWHAQVSPKLPDRVRRTLTPGAARSYILHNLQARLYDNFYCTGTAVAHRPVGSPQQTWVGAFVEQLSRANSGAGYVAGMWRVLATEGGYIAVSRPDLTLWVDPEACIVPGGETTPEAEVGLRLPKEMPAISPGYYMAMGDIALESEHAIDLLRLYWNVTSRGAPALVSLVTRELNSLSLPFRLKVVSNPHSYNRCDTAVLYVRKEDYSALTRTLAQIHAGVGSDMRSGVPALTRPLGCGLALAEDPGHGESFGLHRAMLIAEGLVRAHEAGASGAAERLRFILEHLVERGIDPSRPYLRPRSSGDYEPLLDIGPVKPAPSPLRATVQAGSRVSEASIESYTGDDYLSASHRIGNLLASRAVWYEGQCNWFGPISPESGTAHLGRGYHALGPDLYDGTSGIALYLAELWSQTGDTSLRGTAMGAITQALTRLEQGTNADDIGLYTGWLGIALAAAHVGQLLHEDEPVERVRAILHSCAFPAEPAECDLLSGSAGAIVSLLQLRGTLAEPLLLDQAGRLGDHLLQVADKTRAGYSWRSAGHDFAYNLTGLSHGAAGIGFALLELHSATRDHSYKEGAEQAFAYERSWFDREEGNWPDLRTVPPRSGRKRPGLLPFVSYWCHGAPGIALSRLRAYQLLDDKIYQEEALCALQTTRRAMLAALHAGTSASEFSLCHGLAGLAQVLLQGHRTLGEEEGQDALVATAARLGIERYRDVHAGSEAPGLMLGNAGLGLFYLSLYNPATLPVLLPTAANTKDES